MEMKESDMSKEYHRIPLPMRLPATKIIHSRVMPSAN